MFDMTHCSACLSDNSPYICRHALKRHVTDDAIFVVNFMTWSTSVWAFPAGL